MARWPANPITLCDGHDVDFVTVTGQILMAVHIQLAVVVPDTRREVLTCAFGLAEVRSAAYDGCGDPERARRGVVHAGGLGRPAEFHRHGGRGRPRRGVVVGGGQVVLSLQRITVGRVDGAVHLPGRRLRGVPELRAYAARRA